VVAPEEQINGTSVLANARAAIEQHLQQNEPYLAANLAQAVLKRFPRHLPTYQRLLRAAWLAKRWDEGEEWGKRLLRADPCNALAWRAVAMAVEQRNRRAQAHAIWQRAFEAEPYEPEIRAGLSRTTLPALPDPRTGTSAPDALVLNLACLARLALRGLHWARAAQLYAKLIEMDQRRIDFQVGLLVAHWQQRAQQEAYPLARYLVQGHPHLLVAWAMLNALGDADDKALARNPIETMDPDGEYVHTLLGLSYGQQPAMPALKAKEALLFKG
jgi:tetratricopeptide (TPR) repeat protein